MIQLLCSAYTVIVDFFVKADDLCTSLTKTHFVIMQLQHVLKPATDNIILLNTFKQLFV